MAIYMKFEGISGDVTSSGFESQVEVNALQFGTGRAVGSATNANREGSVASVSEITISKKQDASSTDLFKQALTGTGKTVTFSLTVTSAGTNKVYCKITLSNTLVSGYSLSSSGDRPMEHVSLNFSKIEYQFKSISKDQTQQPKTVIYDLTNQTVA